MSARVRCLPIKLIVVMYRVLEGDVLGRHIYQVYWPYIVNSFSDISKAVTTEDSALLLYLAQHFANQGNMHGAFLMVYCDKLNLLALIVYGRWNTLIIIIIIIPTTIFMVLSS